MELTMSEFAAQWLRIQLFCKKTLFNHKKQLAFLEDLFVLINDGIPAKSALEIMSKTSTGITQEVAISLLNKIAEGQVLADGMRQWFHSNVVEIIRVGEAGGALAQSLQSAIKMLSKRGVAIGAFASAFAYPLFVIAMAAIVMVYISKHVFVQFEYVKPFAQWPVEGQRLVRLAGFIQHWWWLVLLGIISGLFMMRLILINYTGPLRKSLDNYPPFSLYKRLVSARFLETLGLMVANGVVFKSALRIMQYQATPYILAHIAKMENLLGAGITNVAEVLNTGLVSENDLMRLRVLAEVKGFEESLIKMGNHGSEEAVKTLQFIAKIMGGILLIVGFYLVLMTIQGIYVTGMFMGEQ